MMKVIANVVMTSEGVGMSALLRKLDARILHHELATFRMEKSHTAYGCSFRFLHCPATGKVGAMLMFVDFHVWNATCQPQEELIPEALQRFNPTSAGTTWTLGPLVWTWDSHACPQTRSGSSMNRVGPRDCHKVKASEVVRRGRCPTFPRLTPCLRVCSAGLPGAELIKWLCLKVS